MFALMFALGLALRLAPATVLVPEKPPAGCGVTFRPTPTTHMRLLPTLTVSISTPPSLRPRPGPSSSQRSFGHFSAMRGHAAAPPGSCGSSASATARPTASDKPPHCCGANGIDNEKVNDAPALLTQSRPRRPRPRVCSSATSRHGEMSPDRRPCGVRSLRDAPPSSPGRVTGDSGLPLKARARSSSRVLVDSTRACTSTLIPGNSGARLSHRLSAPQCR